MSTSRWLHWTPRKASMIHETSEPEPTKPTKANFGSFVSAPLDGFQKIEVGKHSFGGEAFPHCPRCASYALYRNNNVGKYECRTCGLLDITEEVARRLQ
jgi:Zn ribbon nucleic-acid-binding protein